MKIFQNIETPSKKTVAIAAADFLGAAFLAGVLHTFLARPVMCVVIPEDSKMRTDFKRWGILDGDKLYSYCPPAPPPEPDIFEAFSPKEK